MDRPIILVSLDPGKVYGWLEEAKEQLRADNPLLAFACSWIAFNQCFVAFCVALAKDSKFRKRPVIRFDTLSGHSIKADLRDPFLPDSLKVSLFVGKHNPPFVEFWDSFKQKYGEHFKHSIELPVTDSAFNDVPTPKKHQSLLMELDRSDLFWVLVTIRNNLFHGNKGQDSSRDKELCLAASEFLIRFVRELLEHSEF